MAKISSRRGVKSPFANWELLKPELDSITSRLGHFPSHRELRSLGRDDVRRAIHDYHGGFIVAQQRMGLQPRKKTGNVSLSKWENFSREIGAIAKRLGHFPSTKELIRLRRSDLCGAIRLHGGVDAIRTRMGVALGQKTGARSLSKWDNFERELRAVWKQTGHFPTCGEFEERGRYDLLKAFRCHGGVNKVRQRLGIPLAVKSGEFSLRKWSNLEAALQPFLAQGIFPSTKWLANNGQRDLVNAIINFPGGTNAVRKKFGFKPLKRSPSESFRLWENAKEQLRVLILVFGHFPTTTELIASGNASLEQAIREYHGGLRQARQVFLGEKPKPENRIKVSERDRRLFLDAKRGGDSAKRLLIDRFESVIRKRIQNLERMGFREPGADLHQQAIVGVLKALERNTDANRFFGTVGRVIEGELKDATGKEHGFHLPQKEYSQIIVIAQVTKKLWGSLGRSPSVDEISQATLIPSSQITSLKKRYPRSLFQTDEKGMLLIEKIRAGKI